MEYDGIECSLVKVTLNLGCGTRVFNEYPNGHICINFDERKDLSDKVIFGDVTDLSRYNDEEFDYILASDIIEHFPIAKTKTILKEWKRVLRKKGIIEFRLPDLHAICKRYISGVQSSELTSRLIFGDQDYSGNFHYVIFDFMSFSRILQEVGLTILKKKIVDNNMEVLVMKENRRRINDE